MSDLFYNKGKHLLALQQLNWVTDTMVLMLVTPSYVPDPATHNFVSNVTNELSGSGYARAVLTSRAITRNDGVDKIYFSADEIPFLAINAGICGGAVIYKRVGSDDSTPADDPLFAFLTTAQITTNGTGIIIEFNSNGAFSL